MADKQDLLLFFDRPREPIFMQKGSDNSLFEVPQNFLTKKYAPLGAQLLNRFGGDDAGRRIPVRNISIPNLDLPKELPRQDQFSLFVPKHRKMAGRLIDIFMGMRDVDDLQSMAAYCRDRINPYMFNYCLSVAILHRPDTKGLNLPTFVETFPDKFMDPQVFSQARETATVVPAGMRTTVVLSPNYTASNLELEQRVAYFREDLGVNLHHWHWHLVYPFDAADRTIVDKDRRGELFYYMHQQIIARYNCERLSNGIPPVARYSDFRQPITEGYFPKLDSLIASRAWPPRFANTNIKDLNRPVDQIRSDVSELEQWRDRFIAAIEEGFVQDPNGGRRMLDEATGIDTLGNMMESSQLSINRTFYGDLHNMGHVFISYSHDPDHRHLESFGVMGDSATAMRDPVFYRWHTYVNDIFQLHKNKLPKYTPEALSFPGVTVSSVGVEGSGGARNALKTFWQRSDVDLSRGLDFVPRGPVYTTFTHLQHEPFTYVIDCNNTSGRAVMGTVRIFIAPRDDPQGAPLTYDQQRLQMIELDKFTQNLSPGANKIRRRSTESSVTIPFERTFRNLDQNRPAPGSTDAAEFDFCGCGWPHHMLLPKGTTKGLPMVLFAMISNWNDDKIEQDLVGSCNDAASYCGIRNRKYPDRRSMGFPFDRVGRNGVTTLASFLTPNMASQDCTITFQDRTVSRTA